MKREANLRALVWDYVFYNCDIEHTVRRIPNGRSSQYIPCLVAKPLNQRDVTGKWGGV